MPEFNLIMNKILGVVFMIMVFSIAYAYLKPHRLHRKRMISTLLLKSSYLTYLLVLLNVVFIASFYREGLSEVFPDVEFFAFLLVLFVPTIGIFARKMSYFMKKRTNYNYFFTLVNALSIVAVILMYIF